jgi:hypothetical protein
MTTAPATMSFPTIKLHFRHFMVKLGREVSDQTGATVSGGGIGTVADGFGSKMVSLGACGATGKERGQS